MVRNLVSWDVLCLVGYLKYPDVSKECGCSSSWVGFLLVPKNPWTWRHYFSSKKLRDMLDHPLHNVISQAWYLKTVPSGCSETSVNNYQHTLRNNPEERGPHMHRDGSLKPRSIPNIKTVGTWNLAVRDEFVCGALRALR